MARNAYTKDEVILCAYASMYNLDEFGGIDAIHKITNRSISSIKMKLQNIAAILDEENLPRNPQVKPLSGMPPGEGGRRTHWDIIEPLTRLDRNDLQAMCRQIVDTK